MKFGCCGNLVAKGPDKTGIEIVERIAAYGYDYIELPLAEMMDLSDEEFEELRQRVKASGISCRACNNLFPARLRLTGPEADMEAISDYAGRAMSRAERLGVDTVVFGSGTAKNVPEGFPYEAAYRQVAQITRMLAPLGEKHGITIVIEPIRKPECNIINTFAEGVALAREIGHPYIRVLADYYHMAWEKETLDALRLYGGEYLRHVHFANPNLGSAEGLREGRVYPRSASEWEYQEFIHVLKGIGYDGRISIEAGARDFDSQAKDAIRFMRENF